MPEEIEAVHTHSEAKPLNPKRVRADNYASHYSNHVQVTSSPFEMRMIFAEMAMGESVVEIEEVASIVMSPQHAKALLFLLGSNVARWEQRFGTIDLTKIMPAETEANSPTMAVVNDSTRGREHAPSRAISFEEES